MEAQDVQILLGRRIRALRLRRERTQEALGEQAGLSYKYLGAIEQGERNPFVKQLEKIAMALGSELHELFLCEHEDPPAVAQSPKIGRSARRMCSHADAAPIT